uniref:Uncharacterized protein n=1 Tax=Melopsittacus undulatus TaxID=13146 RepID=A0A8V5HHN0_MELUD
MVPGWKAAAAQEWRVSEMPLCYPSFLLWPREKETAELKEQLATLQASVAEEEARAADLKLKVQLFSSGECKANDQDNILASLRKKVQEVYCQCTGEREGNLETLQMLMVLEKKLNDLLDYLEGIPPEKIEHAKKQKEKERRINKLTPSIQQSKTKQCGFKARIVTLSSYLPFSLHLSSPL